MAYLIDGFSEMNSGINRLYPHYASVARRRQLSVVVSKFVSTAVKLE